MTEQTKDGGAALQALKTRCANAHDRCDGGPCPYCEPVAPIRFENGRFAAREATQ